MKTSTPSRPRNASIAAEPVSPLVAPTMVTPPARARAASPRTAAPISCIATSLNASVGPWNSSSSQSFGPICTQRRPRRVAEAAVGAGEIARNSAVAEGVADERPHHPERHLLVGQPGERGDLVAASAAARSRARRARRRGRARPASPPRNRASGPRRGSRRTASGNRVLQSIRRLIRQSSRPCHPRPDRGEAEPGDRVAEMVVRDFHASPAAASAPRDRRSRRRRASPARSRAPRPSAAVAGEPDVLRAVRRAGEASVSCGQSSDALDGDRPERPRRVLRRDRHEAAVDQDPPPVGERQRRDHPVADAALRAPRCRRAARPAAASPSARTRR